ncbi:sugar isomerase domain-containing protein [Deinococcus sp.]|uniref:sugar isomerase domain-containing protein n=1 Tax=Deinococcus sp. TaxID=47478 RepID=UPI003CC5A007
MTLTFPHQLDRVRDAVLVQEAKLRRVADWYASAIEAGGLIHVYANGHSRIAVEEMIVRMGALTGFHPLLAPGLATFDGVIGMRGIRINQYMERYEGVGAQILAEYEIGPSDVFLVLSATGTTPAAVDFALAVQRRYPEHALVVLACEQQARRAASKHSSGQNLSHVVDAASKAVFLDNAMPYGDLSTEIQGQTGRYLVCPLSSIGALTVVQSLNELTVRELDRRGVAHHVLRNMHLDNTVDNYDQWLLDQRRRYARTLHQPELEGGNAPSSS